MYTPSLPNAIMLKIHEIKSFFTAPSKVHDVTEVIAAPPVSQNPKKSAILKKVTLFPSKGI